MIRSVLVASLLASAPPVRSDISQLPASVTRIAWEAASGDEGTWKAEVLEILDLKIDENGSESERGVALTFDLATLLAKLPMLQGHGALSNSITVEEVAKQPASYGNALSLLLTSYAVRHLYAVHPGLGRTRWKVLLSGSVGAGSRNAREIYSFAFDRPLYERTAWDQVPFTEFPKVAIRFSYNLRFTLDLSHEALGNIDDD